VGNERFRKIEVEIGTPHGTASYTYQTCDSCSCSGRDRCLRRHGVANLKTLLPQEEGTKPPVKHFKAYAPGFVHVDVKYLPQLPD